MSNQNSARELVLVADDEELVLESITSTLELMGLEVITARDGAQALELFEKEQPCLVITDVCMPHRDGLAVASHIKAHRPECPVIVVTGHGDEETVIRALKSGATDYLRKPFQINELRNITSRALSLVRARLIETESFSSLDQSDCRLVIHNYPEAAGGILNYLLRPIENILSESDRLHLRVALQELLINAMEHGNLTILADEKSQALMNDQYESLIKSRSQDPQFSGRRVILDASYQFKKELFKCCIRDEGEGFDWRKVIAAGADGIHSEASVSGRGIFLAKTLMSDVIYNEAGNEVTLVFHWATSSSRDAG